MELAAIAKQATTLREEGRAFLLATVVRTRGSSYRRPGARMLVALGDGGEPDRWLAGSVSGGCLETDVLLRGAWRTHRGATLVTYDSTTNDDIAWGFGLGCNGVVDVLLERISPDSAFDPTRVFAKCFDVARPGALATVFASRDPNVAVGAHLAILPNGTIEGRLPDAFRDAALRAARARRPVNEVLEIDGVTALVETIAPAPHVFVIGTNHDAVPLAALVRTMGWSVTVCDTDARHARRFDDAFIGPPDAVRAAVDATYQAHVVLMTHSYERDRELLRALIDSRAHTIGVLGPALRTERMLSEIGRERPPTLFAPVGLDVGAETPHEIALAIVAEIQATRRDARAGFLRDRTSGIHERSRVVCAVLAAGASSRLGRPKQLVPFLGEPMVRKVTRAALAASCSRVAVIVGAERAGVEGAVNDLDVTCVVNDGWREGIASSVRTAAAWARRERADILVVVLADQPLLTAAHVDRLAAGVRDGAVAAASEYGGVVGVPAAFAASELDALDALEGDHGAARVLRAMAGVERVPWADGNVDVDYERDVLSLEAR